MAVGLTPAYNETISIENFTRNEFFILLVETSKQLNWEISYQSINGIIAYTNKGMFALNAEIKIVIEDNTASIKSASTGNEMFDWGKNKKNVKHFISTFTDLKNQFSAEQLETKFIAIENQLVPADKDLLKLPPPTTTETISGFFSIFKPVEGYFVTPILININIIIFIIMLFCGVDFIEPTNNDLINWGANFRPVTLDGQWWRLISNCFIHIGVFHLLMNMYALMYIGLLLEPHLGKVRFIAAYLLSGLLASVISLWWHDLTISAGASGAIFGMYGVFLILLTTDLIEKNARKALLTSIAVFVGYNLINGLKGGIDNAAHIGGLIAGIIIGYTYIVFIDDEDDRNLISKITGLLTVGFTVISFIICSNLTNDLVVYEEKMKEFNDMEKMALEIYNQVNYLPKEDLLYNIKDRGIYYWNENINLINEVDKLQLPDEIHQRNARMKTYCELRIKLFELLHKTVSEDTDKYKIEIQNYNNQIQSLIDQNKD